VKKLVYLLAVTGLAATPVSASVRDAAFASSADWPAVGTSMFAGATYRVSLDRRTTDARGRASLKLAGMTKAAGSAEIRFGQGLELTGGKTGRPALFLAGQDVGQFKSKAQMSGTTAVVMVGGLILLGVGAVVAINEYKASHCIGERGDCE